MITIPVWCWIWVAIFAILIISLIVLQLISYGMDLGMGYCDNLIDYIKKNHKFNKEWNAEQRAIKAFLKANPLCRECQNNGRFRKAEYCNRDGNELIPACKEHYVSIIEMHHREAEQAKEELEA